MIVSLRNIAGKWNNCVVAMAIMKIRLLQVGQRNFDDTREQLIRRPS
jgi:hypothetical protein